MIFNQAVLAAAAFPQAVCSSDSSVYAENQGQQLNSRLPDSQHALPPPPRVRLGGAEYSFSPARCSGSHDLAEYTVSL